MDILDNSLISRRHDQFISEIDNEIVMLSLENEEYYNMNQIASEIWISIHKPIVFRKLIDKLVAEFEVERKKCEIETSEFLKDLLNKELIDIKN